VRAAQALVTQGDTTARGVGDCGTGYRAAGRSLDWWASTRGKT